ncbi:MAG: TlpA disulfide reductase family protein, partial [Melioribacteraceae bacterium]|nr:TlpA disulfide reductase family protein [Melioribacteraceae bacterium]
SNGFIIYLNDNEGNPLPEALAGHHVALSQWGTWYVELESDNESTSLKFENIFNKYPEVKTPYLDFYLYTLTRIGTEVAISKLSKELETLKSKPDLSKDEIIVLAKYSNMTDNKDDRKKYEKIVLEKFPQSKYAAEIANNEMLSANSPEELKAGFIKFLNEYPNSELAEVSAYRVIRKFVDANDIDGAIKAADEFKEITHPYAFIYSSKKLIAKNKNNEALKLALIGVDAARKNAVSPKSVQPKHLSKSAWDEERENYFAEVLKITATIQNKLESKDEALKLAEEAQSYLEGDDVELNELYSSLLIELEQYTKAKEVLEQYLSENKGSSAMLDNLETAYTKIKGSNTGYDKYVSKFSDAGKAKLIEKLKSKILNEPAPDFELKDINGNVVKFSDYKGKTVIVDFWATWCGPCIRSFPAMQEANNKFNDDKNVEFLFINSWERVENKLENAKKFINENGYKLTVLMDVNNEVISNFKVSGIPTKFIVGPDQKIKFKSVGFAGTNEELVQELSAMIDLAREK